VADDHLPSASLARIRARVMEDVMTSGQPTPRRGLVAALLGAGAVVAVAALAFVFVTGGSTPTPTLVPDPTGGIVPGGGLSASCIQLYSLETLANRDHAFDGTVTDVKGDRVTFAVKTAYKGVTSGSISLDAPGMTGNAITSVGGPNFRVGERYLVAGDSTFAWACGFSQPYDGSVAADWAEVFGG
jgi:hypothetical protein